MPPYEIVIRPGVKREIKRLSRKEMVSVIAAIEKLRNDPRPHGVEKLSGKKTYYRIRVGDIRIIYDIQEKRLSVLVIHIRRRDKAYR